MQLKYIDEFRQGDMARRLADRIRETSKRPIKLMEVCGTHTVTIFRHGLRDLLPPHITLVSGPGCPVCVTPVGAIDRAILLSQREEVIIATFGDLLRVPGSESSLLRQRSSGADVRVVYSAYDALETARRERERKVVFLGVGFETTAPTVAAVIRRAKDEGAANFSVLSMHKIIPPALKALVESPDLRIDGLICPGHVSTIIGTEPYRPTAEQFRVPCVVAGFEPVDILQAIALLVNQIEAGEAKVENQYRRAVKAQGNPRARATMEEVFVESDSVWRGLGVLPLSGLEVAPAYGAFDAGRVYEVPLVEGREPAGCICGEILRGLEQPPACPLFRRECTPESPVGACMVSSEGTCAAYYKYSDEDRAD